MNKILSELGTFYNNQYEPYIKHHFLSSQKNVRKPTFSMIKVAFIIFLYHKSHYKDLKSFYLEHICKKYKRLLGKLPTYSWFLRLKNRCLHFVSCFLQSKFKESQGVCIVDSTPIPVCHNLRIKSHKVCKDNACRSKSSMGWYYGFKLHTIINHKGEIVKIYVSEATLDDRKGLKSMINGLKGIIIGDKGYLSKNLKSELAEKDINLVTNYKKNMKNKPKHSEFETGLLQKRKSVETFFYLLKDKYNLKCTKCRSQTSLFIAIISACCAYVINEQKIKTNIDLGE